MTKPPSWYKSWRGDGVRAKGQSRQQRRHAGRSEPRMRSAHPGYHEAEYGRTGLMQRFLERKWYAIGFFPGMGYIK